MASTSETGHAVNFNNFNTLIARCTGYGILYNPSNNLIKLPALNATSTNAGAAFQQITLTKPPWDTNINIRQQWFSDMSQLAGRVVNAFDACENITDLQVEDAKVFLRKIRGERKSKKILNPNPDDPQQISVSQLSFANQLMHFAGLVGFVTSTPDYVPNETELQPPNLTVFLGQLNTVNQNVTTTVQPYLDALGARNLILYGDKTGIYDLQKEVKKYVKSVQAITLEQFRQISGLRFRKPPKTK